MANKRMFSLSVVDSDRFTEMPTSSQALYFHLGMRADDDGFISSPKRIIRSLGFPDDDIKILIAKGFVYVFDTGICVITHWKLNNTIQKDRYKKTIHYKEASLLTEDDASLYVIKNHDVSKLETGCIQNVSKAETQIRLGEISLDQEILSGKPNGEPSAGSKPKKTNQELEDKITESLESFNEVTNKKFSPISEKNRKLVKKILTSKLSYHDVQEVGSVPMIKTVVRFKYNQWKNDPVMRAYIQPDTILNFRNFEKYLEEYQNAE